MAKKISKSDTLDLEQEARDREWLESLTASWLASKHFAPGTYVLHQGRRYEVISRNRHVLTVSDDGGNESLLYPLALKNISNYDVEENK